MRDFKNDHRDNEALDWWIDDDTPPKPVDETPLPVARPGRHWVNAARRAGQDDEYDNMMADRYGEGW